ncbi:CYTH domain-containing protein [Methylobacterium nigriterrae]|uniref:CYTH domain-containing protein n=1 Tax=Methylobacterium nigriterrae TaxID=3127512 RepID=UPI003013C2B8
MQLEIERRFLTAPAVLGHCRSGIRIRQGYLHTDDESTLRVRIAGERSFLTWKGPRVGAMRTEDEREVPRATADFLFSLVPPDRILEKTRYRIDHAGLTWDVDVFDGALAGLILAEVELEREDQPVPLPPWVRREVTQDPRYRNSRLAGRKGYPRRRAA